MEKQRGFARSLEKFFAGKGFYIVLFLCVAVIGVSAWAMLIGTGTHVEDDGESIAAYEGYSPVGPVIPPAERQVQVPNDAVREAPAATVQVAKPPQNTEAPKQTEAPAVEPRAEATQAPANAEAPAMASGVYSTSFVWPLVGETEIPYSASALIYNKTMADWRAHEGIDIAADLGAQVMAVSSGRVERLYTDDLYGVTLIIDHGGGLRSVYSNLAETPVVYEGSSVVTGEIIGAVGTTALAEAGEVTHLHLGMTQDGVSVDPAPYLPPR